MTKCICSIDRIYWINRKYIYINHCHFFFFSFTIIQISLSGKIFKKTSVALLYVLENIRQYVSINSWESWKITELLTEILPFQPNLILVTQSEKSMLGDWEKFVLISWWRD